MSKPTTITMKDIPELLGFIDEVKNEWVWQPEEDAMFDAIRASLPRLEELEKAVGKWSNRANELLSFSRSRPATTRELLREIRDFGLDGEAVLPAKGE